MPDADIPPPHQAVRANRPFWSPGRRVALIIAGTVAALGLIGGGVAYAQSDSDTGSGEVRSTEDCAGRTGSGRPPGSGDGETPSPAPTETQ
jgi:hypothetical protein